MTDNQFQEILEKRLKDTKEILSNKAREYATSEDRLHNFKRAGELLRCTPEDALLGMQAKHIISIIDLVDSLNHNYLPLKEYIEEKIGDAINYFILLEALLIERIANYGK